MVKTNFLSVTSMLDHVMFVKMSMMGSNLYIHDHYRFWEGAMKKVPTTQGLFTCSYWMVGNQIRNCGSVYGLRKASLWVGFGVVSQGKSMSMGRWGMERINPPKRSRSSLDISAGRV